MTDTDRKDSNLLKGMSYLPGIKGVVRLGVTTAREVGGSDVRVPAKLDEFIVTQKHRDDNGNWVYDERDPQLRQQYGVGDSDETKKLRRIPIRIAYDNPDLTVNEQFAAFSNNGRPLCVGNGATAKRAIVNQAGLTESIETVNCPGVEACPFGQQNRCDAFMRLVFQIEGQKDDEGLYILRTGSYNAVSEIRAKLEELYALFGGKLAGVTMWLDLETKQSPMSNQTVFWYPTLRGRYETRLAMAKQLNAERNDEKEAGIDRESSERRLISLRSNGGFAEGGDGDSQQFDDLIAARFVDECGEERKIAPQPRRTGNRLGHVVQEGDASAQVLQALKIGASTTPEKAEALAQE